MPLDPSPFMQPPGFGADYTNAHAAQWQGQQPWIEAETHDDNITQGLHQWSGNLSHRARGGQWRTTTSTTHVGREEFRYIRGSYIWNVLYDEYLFADSTESFLASTDVHTDEESGKLYTDGQVAWMKTYLTRTKECYVTDASLREPRE